MNSALNAIDTELALERAGGNPNLARDLYQMLQNELPGYLSQLQQLFEQKDYPALQELAHKIHGSATYCGVPALKDAARELENAIKQDLLEQCEDDLTILIGEIERLQLTPELEL